MDSGRRPEWAARYAAELMRRGAEGSLKEFVARGLQMWITAGHERPEVVAMVHHRAANGRSPPSWQRWKEEGPDDESSSTS